jgi:biopolymer transport protein ExbD
MRVRRLRREPAGLDVTAFINLIVVLVPFLLSTAVFTRLSVLDLALPAQSTGALEKLSVDKLNLEVVIRADALEVGDRIGGLIQRIPRTADGHYDVPALAALARALKEKFPSQTDATLLPEPNVPYDVLVQVMDAMRAGRQVQGTKVVEVALFPDLSIGDAPIRQAAAGGAR